jgi:Domain of unknown function (DUF4760)
MQQHDHHLAENFTKLVNWKAEEAYKRVMIWVFNPSRLLRLMLGAMWLLFFAFILLEKDMFKGMWIHQYQVGMSKQDWLPTAGVLLAATGWITSAIVTIRNSVKQHTINTLLQTRLSATYQDYAADARAGLKGHTPEFPAPLSTIKASDDCLAGVEYLLNYIEFMAVGIRHGDLHEAVLKDSMRGIVTRFTDISQEYIDDCRERNGLRTYQHLLWLRDRWKG